MYKSIFSNQILDNCDKNKYIGLFHGKMGIAIYFYHLARLTKEKKWEQKADELIEDIYDHIGKTLISTDFEYGLSGIGWAIEYLAQNRFVDAETDLVLESIDGLIFKYLTQMETPRLNIQNGLLGYASYIISRLKSSKNIETHYFMEQLFIIVLNEIAMFVETDDDLFIEPPEFNVVWDIPWLMILLGESMQFNVHRRKVVKILEGMQDRFVTLFPKKHCNRAFFLLGLKIILKNYTSPEIEKHAQLLMLNINWNTILKEEFGAKKMEIEKGLTGAILILMFLDQVDSHCLTHNCIPFCIDEIFDRLSKYNPNDLQKIQDQGLLTGLTGMELVFILTKEKANRLQWLA